MCKQILLCVCVSVCQFIQDLVLSWPLDLCQYWNLPPVGWGWNCPIRALSPNWLLLQSVVYVSSSPSLPWPNHVTLPQPLYTRCRGLHVIPSESCPPSYCDRANPIMYADHPFSFSACYEPPSAPNPTKLKSNVPLSTTLSARSLTETWQFTKAGGPIIKCFYECTVYVCTMPKKLCGDSLCSEPRGSKGRL